MSEPETGEINVKKSEGTNDLLSVVIAEVESCLYDYESAFKVSAEPNIDNEAIPSFMVTITQEALPEHQNTAFFCMKVENGEYEMEMGEDIWYDLNTENLFVFLYFDAASKLRNR